MSGGSKTIPNAFILTGSILVALMLTCLVAGLVQSGRYFFPGWRGEYWLWVGFLVALDGMVSQRTLRHTRFPEMAWFLYRGSEWVVIAVLLKLGYYLAHGLVNVQADFAFLAAQQWSGFFSGEFLLGLGAMVLVWALSGQYTDYLWKLDVNLALIRIEQESGIYEKRTETRESLATLTLVTGLGMTMVFAFFRSDLGENWRSSLAMADGMHLVIYFLLSLVLLSLTQYSLLKAGWVRDGIQTSGDMLSRWMAASGGLILVLALLALILPTYYSLGFLQLFQTLLTILIAAVGFLYFILWSPVYILLSFFASLFGSNLEMDAPIPPEALQLPPAAETQTPLPWLEILKSLLVWGLLVSAVVFAIVYYVREHKSALQMLRQASFYTGWQRFWKWLRSWFERANLAAADTLRSGLAAIRSRLNRQAATPAGDYLSLRRLSPRQQVYFYYLALIRRGAENGITRAPAQTPYEYFRLLQKQVAESRMKTEVETRAAGGDPASSGSQADTAQAVEEAPASWLSDAQTLTEAYIRARYSRSSVSSDDIGLVKRSWERIRRALRRLR